MAAPYEPETDSKSGAIVRPRHARVLLVWSAKIGFFVLLYFVGLLVASVFAKAPRPFWMICFVLSLLGLCGYFAAWLILAYRSMGYGISGSFLFWEYWLLALASGVSASFAFSGLQRYFVLLLVVSGVWLSSQFVPLLWYVPVRAVSRLLRQVR
jgi:hypothetical protein